MINKEKRFKLPFYKSLLDFEISNFFK